MTDDSAVAEHARGELLRAAECAVEPIHLPGRIQSHGILLGIDVISSVINVASANAREWLGRPLTELGSPTLEWCVASGSHVDPVRVELLGSAWDAIVHHVADRAIVELEPAVASMEFARTSVVGAIQRLGRLTEVAAVRAETVEEIRRVTGFDHVMLYHFHDDGHGEVVAEARADDVTPYLGLHFPASDIPAQARRLYLTKVSRAIVDTEDAGTPLLTLDPAEPPLDLSLGELRAVSPHHLQYMRNMGQASTVSLSLISEGRLIGMVTCAHREQRRIPVLLRRALEVLAGQLTLQLVSLQAIERLSRAIAVREARTALLAPLAASGDVLDTLLTGRTTILDLVPADAAIAQLDGVTRARGDLGATDPADVVAEIAGAALATDSLAATHPALAAALPGFAGLLAVPLADNRGTLVLLRREAGRVVRWLGDLGDANRDTALSPRRSFAEWKQSVSDTAQPWGELVDEAADLGRELDDVLFRREEVRRAELADIDPLTGLRNRRFLDERLETPATGALLFLDLDDFKSINDRHGHEVGDEVLLTVAQRIRDTCRAGDEPVRLGGDEFVVLCADVDEHEALAIAERLITAIGRPIRSAIAGRLTVTASCGVVEVRSALTGGQLLEAADAAMYRAKRDGRNRASR
ncbi:MAG: diguanylate cyclase [Actinomycetales bacterium]|nr:diguanylate cyclase [Actinomycetales bacterium]